MNRRTEYLLAGIAVLILGLAAILYFFGPSTGSKSPLSGRQFYVDTTRDVNRTATEYRDDGKTEEADLLKKIADQPSATWLTGPTDTDQEANIDIAEVARTSAAARAQGKLVVYQMYAIPNRDACAEYSKAGFSNGEDYQKWVDRILEALDGEAVFSVEADAVSHAIQKDCMTSQEREERFAILRETMRKLKQSPNVKAAYLDAGHAEWMPNVNELVEPLRQAGVDDARGVAVNVSAFVDTDTITKWSADLAAALGGDKGVLVDTSRNGRGSAPENVKGDARWCNPPGRGLGPVATTDTGRDSIDAFVYIKTVGESDGNCFGNPPAGEFVPELALELARNARQ